MDEIKKNVYNSYRPPNHPWMELIGSLENGGYLSFYYSDPFSDIPVRNISSEFDSKSDPNLETGTYGLFSSCERGMRASVVKRKIKYIFFCTARSDSRVLTGFYELGWYNKGPTIEGYSNSRKVNLTDYALAAIRFKFVNPGFPLNSLTGLLEGEDLSVPFRTQKRVSKRATTKLLKLLDRTEDKTSEYLSEIKRLEHRNIEKVEYAYPNWKRKNGFTWDDAGHYLGAE